MTGAAHTKTGQHRATRRATVITLAAACTLSACDWIAAQTTSLDAGQLSAEDKALKLKFRGIQGVELLVDSIEEIHGVNMFKPDGNRFFVRATMSIRNSSRSSYAGLDLVVPKWIRVEWRDPADDWRLDGPQGTAKGGRIVADYTAQIASRIPSALLDEVRAGKGGLRLKIRVHPQGVLVGWDRYVWLERDGASAGGDFREAKIFNGIAERKGWYIHPKTGQKIETDF